MTKKELQLQENEIALEHYTKFKAVLDEELRHPYTVKRLRTMSAEILYTENYYILRSYNTLIAFMPINTGRVIDVLRLVYGYTATSAKHISAFCNQLHATSRYTWKEV